MLTKILAGAILALLFISFFAFVEYIEDSERNFWFYFLATSVIVIFGLAMYFIGYYVIPWCFKVLFD